MSIQVAGAINGLARRYKENSVTCVKKKENAASISANLLFGGDAVAD